MDDLESIGHKVQEQDSFGSVVAGVQRDEDDMLTANTDFRRGGVVDGF